MANVIEFKAVGKRYPEERVFALHDMSFSVAEGEFLCIIGPLAAGRARY
jgi:ABC-type ATPase involved in cell division